MTPVTSTIGTAASGMTVPNHTAEANTDKGSEERRAANIDAAQKTSETPASGDERTLQRTPPRAEGGSQATRREGNEPGSKLDVEA